MGEVHCRDGLFGRDGLAEGTICPIMPNDETVKHDWPHYRVSLKKVEKLTGYSFFDKVPAETLAELKEKVDEVKIREPRRRPKKTDE